MPKYYVDSGQMQFITNAEEPIDAVLNAISKCSNNTRLGKIIRINEKGFLKEHDDDLYVCTVKVLQQLGIGFQEDD